MFRFGSGGLCQLACGLEFGLDEGGGVALAAGGHLLGRAGKHQCAAAASALGPHVDEVVGHLDDVEVVLDDDDRVALVDELLQHLQEHLYVVEVQPRGGLVEQVDGAACVALGQFGGQLYALALAA